MKRTWSLSARGQSLVEFTLILPVIMTLVLGMTELGFAINHNTSIETATRQGARVGSELVNGERSCGMGVTTNSQAVDAQIIAAVEGALVSPGSPVDPSQVSSIKIYQANADGSISSKVNTWTYSYHGGPLLPGAAQKLDFVQGGVAWDASTRCGSAPAPSIGVQITYTYRFITPLGAFVSMFTSAQIPMSDQTVMALEPPAQ
jgi:Flp pilus assembly protein TadG